MKNSTETVDHLHISQLQIVQAKNGYRFSLDPVLLSHFVRGTQARSVVDLGTGVGVIPLILAHLTTASELVGIELQSAPAGRAQRNVELNGCQQRVRIVEGDIRRIRELLPPSSADLVVSNPPFRKPENGRLAPNGERAAARHELAGGLEDFVRAAAWLLNHGGRFALIHLAERMPELFRVMEDHSLTPKRMRIVYPRLHEPARMVLVEGCRGGRPGLAVEAPLIVYSGAGREYSPEVLAMYDDK